MSDPKQTKDMYHGTLTTEQKDRLTELQRRAGELAKQALEVAKEAETLIGPTDEEMEDAWRQTVEDQRDMGAEAVDTGTAHGLWDVLDTVLSNREADAEID